MKLSILDFADGDLKDNKVKNKTTRVNNTHKIQ